MSAANDGVCFQCREGLAFRCSLQRRQHCGGIDRFLHGVGFVVDPVAHHEQIAAEFFDQRNKFGYLVLGEDLG